MEKEIKEEKKKSKLSNTLIIMVIVLLSVIMYSKYVETRFIRVSEYIVRDNIPNNFNGLNVVYFSDLLYGSVDIKYVENLVKRINEMKPDIVLFSGSLVSKNTKITKSDKDKLINNLTNIDYNIGKYYVTSYIDNEITNEILDNSNFILMDNKYELIFNKGNTPLCLYGIGSYNKGNYKFDELVNCSGYYTIMFTHEGDVLDKVLSVDVKPNIFMSGNTLGGEVNIPIYNNLIKYKGSTKYYLPYYNKNNVKVYISNGIGTDELGIRLNNPPSFTLIRLKSTN